MVRGKKFRFRLKKDPQQLFECMDNIQSSLNYLEAKGIVIVNIGAGDIYHGNMKITLGLIWTLIQTYQIDANQGISEAQGGAAPKLEEPSTKLCTGAQLLLQWCQSTVASYVASGLGAQPRDFAGSFSSGITIACLIHAHFPALIDLAQLRGGDSRANLELVMVVASKHLGIPRMLDPEDVDMLLASPHSVSKVVQLCVRRSSLARAHRSTHPERLDE
jgi:actinin alpha